MPTDSSPIETIRLSDKDKHKLLQYVEQSSRRQVDNDRRNLRVDFQARRVLVTTISQEGQRVRHGVVPRNLSRWGLAFVHGQFIYPDSRCEIALPMQDGKWAMLEGVVRNCRHITGIIHEVAIKFDEAIDLSQYVRLSSTEQERHRAEQDQDIDPQTMLDAESSGRALLIDNATTERKLHRLWLSQMNMTVAEANGVTTTTERMDSSEFDMVVINLELTQDPALDLIKHLRKSGFSRSIIAVSTDESDESRDQAMAAGANELLTKPFTDQDLKSTVEKVIGSDGLDSAGDNPIYSSIAGNEDMTPIIEEFVNSLSPLATRLRRAVADSDLETVTTLCKNLKGSGSGYGFEILTESAREAMNHLDSAQQDAESVRKSVNELILIIKRIKCGSA